MILTEITNWYKLGPGGQKYDKFKFNLLIEDISVIKPSADVLCKKTVLKRFENFVKFTEKHLCQSLFFNRTAGLSLQLYIIKKDCGTGAFL